MDLDLLTKVQLKSKERMAQVKSQKAKAIFNYEQHYDSWSISKDWVVPEVIPILLDDNILHLNSASAIVGFPCFLRTCPENPRAGVLDSIRCNDITELKDNFNLLRDAMCKDDPEGCLILMPFIDADDSAVVALSHPLLDGDGNAIMNDEKPVLFQGYAIFGQGHDGVTAGGEGSNALAFPLVTDDADSNTLTVLNYSPSNHELEFVFSHEDTRKRGLYNQSSAQEAWLTQIRNAPEHTPVFPPPKGVDTIGMVPAKLGGECIVKEFVVMNGLEEVAWLEENITEEKCPEGFFVVEPNGSRLSHIYAHCRGAGVPYAITSSVTIGDRWVEVAPGWVVLDNDHKFEPQPYDPIEYVDDFIRGLKSANNHWRTKHGWLSTFFHQWVSLPYSKPQDVAFLAGHFAGWLAKAITALGLGEMRHAKNIKNNANALLYAPLKACIGSDILIKIDDNKDLPTVRSHYYACMERVRVNWEHNALMQEFLAKHFSKDWSGGFGGKPWADSMRAGAKVSNAIANFIEEPNEITISQLIQVVNSAENCVHNNGFLFNKFLEKKAFDCGTGGFRAREHMANMSALYQMATSLLSPSEEALANVSESPKNDWEEILTFMKKNSSPSYWRLNPIGKSEKIPTVIRDAALSLSARWLHGEKGTHNSSQSDKFIMCGKDGCGRCSNHLVWLENNPDKAQHMQHVKSMFSDEQINIMMTPVELDVWLTGSQVETRITVKQQIQLIKQKEYSPTPDEFNEIYASLNDNDPDYPDMVLVLNKWLAKQDNLEDFLKAMLPKKKDEKKESDVQ